MSYTLNQKALNDFIHNKFGLFIHFGLYSILGRGEWVQHIERIPPVEYANLMSLWNCRDFNAPMIVKLAKQAGMKYITFTTKHHEGFLLFDTAYSDFKSTNSAAGRDIIREIITACKENDIKIFLYYSLPDWHCKDYQDDFSSYREYVKNQLYELLTNYGKIDGVWFDNLHFYYAFPDGNPLGYKVEDWNIIPIYQFMHELQPDLLIGINRVDSPMILPEGYDFDAFEKKLTQDLPDIGLRPIEICDTATPGIWGWDTRCRHTLKTKQIIEKLLWCCGTGANLLMNVGLECYGKVSEDACNWLREVGLFTERYSEAIYGVKPVSEYKGNFIVRKNERIYGYLLNSENDIYLLNVADMKINEVILLFSHKKIKWEKEENILSVNICDENIDPWCSVIEILYI